MGKWCVNGGATYRMFSEGTKANTTLVVFEKSSHMALFEEEQRFLEIVGDFITKKD